MLLFDTHRLHSETTIEDVMAINNVLSLEADRAITHFSISHYSYTVF